MRIKQIHTQKGSTDIMNYGYVYDKVGNITRKTTEKGVSDYSYDRAYRLTGATHPTLTNETFSYDKVGNRLSTQASATPWTYNNADQLLTTPEATYQYNVNGHTKNVDYTDTALPDMAYSYDARERLKRVLKTDDGSEIQSNRYDYNNRRLVKTTTNATTYFLYSSKGLEAEYDTGGSLVQGYLFGANSYSTNPILTYKKNGANLEYHFYHNDHLFTPQRLTDSIGVLSWSADYSAFGETTITKETITNNLRFPGQYYDKDIKLAQNYFRDYSAELGRYVESDPIGLNGDFNFYNYSESNSIVFVDSFGLATEGLLATCPAGGLLNPICDVGILINGCKWTAIAMGVYGVYSISNELTKEQRREKGKERQAYKKRCDEPNPNLRGGNLSLCELAKWKVNRAKDCINMRKAFNRKWGSDPGHDEQVAQKIRELNKALKEVELYCSEDCKGCN